MIKVKYVDELNRFDFGRFIKNQKTIMERWHRDVDNDTDFINGLSKYLLNTIDELHEMNTSKSYEEHKKETIDVLMYTASAFVFVIKYFNNKVTKDEEISLNDFYYYYYDDDSKNIKTTYILYVSKLINYFGEIRELFPERKWHMKKNTIKDEDNLKRLNKTMIILMKCMKLTIKYFLNYFSLKELNDTIKEKELKIIEKALKQEIEIEMKEDKKLELIELEEKLKENA